MALVTLWRITNVRAGMFHNFSSKTVTYAAFLVHCAWVKYYFDTIPMFYLTFIYIILTILYVILYCMYNVTMNSRSEWSHHKTGAQHYLVDQKFRYDPNRHRELRHTPVVAFFLSEITVYIIQLILRKKINQLR